MKRSRSDAVHQQKKQRHCRESDFDFQSITSSQLSEEVYQGASDRVTRGALAPLDLNVQTNVPKERVHQKSQAAIRKSRKRRFKNLHQKAKEYYASQLPSSSISAVENIHSELFKCPPDWRWKKEDYRQLMHTGWCNHLISKLRRCKSQRSAAAMHRIIVDEDLLPLSYASHNLLLRKIEAVLPMLTAIRNNYNAGNVRDVVNLSEYLAQYREEYYSASLLRRWTKELLSDGNFVNVKFTRWKPGTLMNDENIRCDMLHWLQGACYANPPMRAQDFSAFVESSYSVKICTVTAAS